MLNGIACSFGVKIPQILEFFCYFLLYISNVDVMISMITVIIIRMIEITVFFFPGQLSFLRMVSF